METPQLRGHPLEGSCGDLKDNNKETTCSHSADSRPHGSMNEIERVVGEAPITKQACSDPDDRSTESWNIRHVGQATPGSSKNDGNGGTGNSNGTSNGKGENGVVRVVKRSLSETNIGDQISRDPDICDYKGGSDGDVGHKSGGGSNSSSTTDGSVANLNRDNLLLMIATDSLVQQRPAQPQQEREGAEEDNPDRGSSSTLVENAKAGEEFQALNTQETASGYVETERANVAAGSSSAVNQHQNPDDLAPERSEQDVTSLTTDEVSSATDDSGKNSGGRTEKEPDVERPKPGSELEQQLMARLLEYESGPAAVKDEAGSEEHAWTIGREWREWLWNAFLFLVVIFAMVIWNVDSSSVSVTQPRATVQTAPAPPTFFGAMDALGARTRPNFSNNVKPTTRNGHGIGENSFVRFNNDDGAERRKTHTNEQATQNNKKDTTNNAEKRSTIYGEDDRSAASAGEGQHRQGDPSSHRDQPKGQSKGERLRKRWAGWGVVFEEMLDGPWI